MRVVSLVLSAVCLAGAPSATQFSATLGAPETFMSQAQVIGSALGAAAAPIKIVIQRYTPEAERRAIEAALGDRRVSCFPTCTSRSRPTSDTSSTARRSSPSDTHAKPRRDKGRRIDVVTDRPIFFVGGGAPDARPRESFDVAVLRMEVDGHRVLAAA